MSFTIFEVVFLICILFVFNIVSFLWWKAHYHTRVISNLTFEANWLLYSTFNDCNHPNIVLVPRYDMHVIGYKVLLHEGYRNTPLGIIKCYPTGKYYFKDTRTNKEEVFDSMEEVLRSINWENIYSDKILQDLECYGNLEYLQEMNDIYNNYKVKLKSK